MTSLCEKYRPKHFLRVHSRADDPCDIQAQVWTCAFEPNLSDPGHHTNLVATCGGWSVCFIDFRMGEVKMKFNSPRKEPFFDIAWGTTCQGTRNILAAAGASRNIHIITPSEGRVQKSALQDFGKNDAINSIVFHPIYQDMLFCGKSTGEVLIIKVETYEANPLQFLHSLCINTEPSWDIKQLAFNQHCNALLAACDRGLRVWFLQKDFRADDAEGQAVDIPRAPSKEGDSDSFFDSVVTLGSSSLVATKRALEGYIIIWDLATLLKSPKKRKPIISVKEGYKLQWSDTDEYYLKLSWDDSKQILACGDSQGTIWLYDLSFHFKMCDPTMDELSSAPPLQPVRQINWPSKVTDDYLTKKRKLKLGTYGILVQQVAMSGSYLIAVTNNNVVCIWHGTDS